MTTSGTAGDGDYEVAPGDCIESIAFGHGFFWRTLWELPENRSLKEQRGTPNQLLPGDRLHVPALRRREVPAATEKRHRFRRKGVPSRLRLCFTHRGEPLANLPYALQIDGRTTTGETDADGFIEVPIVPDARRAHERIGSNPHTMLEYDLRLGGIDPIGEISGVQQRLANLGYDCPETGAVDAATRRALATFQQRAELEVTGEPDEATREKLAEAFGH